MAEKLKEGLKELQKAEEFKNFKKKNPKAYLASCVTIVEGKNVGDWQVGYYIPKKHKITSFVLKEHIESKGEDDVFQKEKTSIKKLNLKKVKINLSKALEILEKLRKKKYSGEFPNKVIAVLQVIEDEPVWNLTLLTTTLKVLNVKLDAVNGSVISDKIENFLSFKAS